MRTKITLAACAFLGLSAAHSISISSHRHAPQITDPIPTRALIISSAKQAGLRPNLLLSLVAQESSFDPLAERYEPKLKSSSIGLMQIVAKFWVNSPTCPNIKHDYDLYDPALNLECGTAILSKALKEQRNHRPNSFTHAALVQYNGGSGCFKSNKCYKLASNYADKIIKNMHLYK